MNDIQFVYIFNTSYDLVKETSSLQILNSLILHYVVKQLPPSRKFHH